MAEIRSAGPALAVHHLIKMFGHVAAVDDVSFSISSGTFLTLLGPSGSGKTTLLRLLSGFEAPDGGSIEIGGAEISRLPPYRRNIGVVFQHCALFPHMSVAENIAFPLKQRGVPKAECASRVEGIMDTVGLPGFGSRDPSTLSGGQQRRVALARALVFEPEILMMDEPLTALDRGLREQMQAEVRTLQQRFGITTVYVTHDQTEAFAMSDLVAILNAGKIEQIDEPRTIYERPLTEFVACFVGASNLFHGENTVASSTEGAMRLSDGSLLRYPGSVGQSERVTVLVRPEKISIDDSEAGPLSGNVLRGRILSATYLGEAIIYRIFAGGEEVLVRQQVDEPLIPGAEVTLSWAVNDTAVL